MQLHLFVHIELLHKETLPQILFYLIMPKISCLKFNSRSVNHRGLLSHAELGFHLFSCGSLFCWAGLDVYRTSPSPQGMIENLFPAENILSPQQRKKNDFVVKLQGCFSLGCVYTKAHVQERQKGLMVRVSFTGVKVLILKVFHFLC